MAICRLCVHELGDRSCNFFRIVTLELLGTMRCWEIFVLINRVHLLICPFSIRLRSRASWRSDLCLEFPGICHGGALCSGELIHFVMTLKISLRSYRSTGLYRLHGLLVKCVCSTLAEGPLANGPSARFPLSLLHGVPLGRSKMNLEPMDLTLSAPRQSTPRRGPPPEHDYFMPDEITQAPGEHG